jgi:hypothetical protein
MDKAARKIVERMYNLLNQEKIQWADSFEGDRRCVFCEKWQYSDKHSESCELAQALKEAKEFLEINK